MRTNPLRLGLALALGAALFAPVILTQGTPALAKGGQKHFGNTIDYQQGRIAGAAIDMTWAEVVKNMGKPKSQTPFLGFERLYLAYYKKKTLAVVYFNATRAKRFDTVVGVLTGNKVFSGPKAIGDTYYPGDCIGPDGHADSGPDGGPKTADFCRYREAPFFSYFTMLNGGHRATETIDWVAIFTPKLGRLGWQYVEATEEDETECVLPDCDIHTD
jgi:hypothetical protein